MLPVIIEVVLSLIVIYFLMSTFVSFVYEMMAMLFNTRGRVLKRSILHLLGEKDNSTSFTSKIYDSKYIINLPSKILGKEIKYKLPEYITAENFSGAILEQIKKETSLNIDSFSELKAAIEKLNNDFLKTKLSEIIKDAEDKKDNTILAVKTGLQNWYNNYMESIKIVYKNQSQIIIGFISFVTCLVLNIDSLVLIEYFYENKDKRELMVKQAENLSENAYYVDSTLPDTAKFDTIKARQQQILATINSFDLPFGWKKDSIITKKDTAYNYSYSKTMKEEARLLGNTSKSSWPIKLLGIFITAIALTLGAPFWYKTMVNVLDLRKATTPKTNSA
ncbi:MAG: hypothetical protein U0U67_11040 [Chitinophagales bacterium]